jgi:hypothetical protein
VVAGDPFRCGEADGAGGNGNVDLGVVELARSVGEIRDDLDWVFLGFKKAWWGEQQG